MVIALHQKFKISCNEKKNSKIEKNLPELLDPLRNYQRPILRLDDHFFVWRVQVRAARWARTKSRIRPDFQTLVEKSQPIDPVEIERERPIFRLEA